jgi:glutathione S-transferase
MQGLEYLAINPMGKVPALTHGKAVVTETAAICAYLASQFPEKQLMPANSEGQAAFFRWLFFCSRSFRASGHCKITKLVGCT